MTIISASGFLQALRESEVLTGEQLDRAARELASGCASATELADALVAGGLLTRFQADEVLKGHGPALTLGPYLLLDPLGRGGMGDVFRARHRVLRRLAAVKVIRGELLARPGAVNRFLREARAAAALQHPHVVTIYDAGADREVHYLAMEYVEGIDLGRLVHSSGSLPVGLACNYIRQAALGLEHAHEHGLVHRDIKPTNLIVTGHGSAGATVKILDFGLARFVSELPEDETLTPPERWLGTPDFIAPEQARAGHAADIRADVFSLGCTLFYLLTGQTAYAGGSSTARLAARLIEDARPLRPLRGDAPPALEAILQRMLSRDLTARYQTPAEVADALEPFSHVESDEPPTVAAAPPTTEQATPRLDGRPPMPSGARTDPLAPVALGWLSRRWVVSIAVGVAMALLLGAAAYWWPRNTRNAPVLVNSIGMKLMPIPAGDFFMGSPLNEALRAPDEAHLRKVAVAAFYLGRTEVTQREYQDVMGHNPSHFRADGAGGQLVAGLETDRFPVESVSWEDAVNFCRRLSERPEEKDAGRTYRLPTEAEWEYACRAGTTTPFHVGDAITSTHANMNGQIPYGVAPAGVNHPRTVPVGGYAPNAFGLLDMHGNVWEWCADAYAPNGEVPGPVRRPADVQRTLRGGSWFFGGADCRCARRFAQRQAMKSSYYGFRVACDVRGK